MTQTVARGNNLSQEATDSQLASARAIASKSAQKAAIRAIKQAANPDAKAFDSIENAAVISRTMPFFADEDRALITEQELTREEITNKFWIERACIGYRAMSGSANDIACELSSGLSLSVVDFVFYPNELQFDLAATIAKRTLNKLASQEDRFDRERDENGLIIGSTFVAGLDDDAARFYVTTLTENLRRYFVEPKSNHFIVQQLSASAAKGVVESQEKSGMTDEELSVALTRAKDGFKERDRRRFLEIIALNSGLISAHTKKKCTHYACNSFEDRMKATKIWMKSHTVSNGKMTFKLSEIGQTMYKRTSEMYSQALGMQGEASAAGMQWASVVATPPAIKHPNPKNGNNTWDGTTPKQSNKEFSLKFARVRAMLAKKDITLVGIWTREAHADAAPHVNYLIYFNAGQEETVKAAFETHFAHSARAIEFKIGVDGGTYIDKNGNEAKTASFASYAMKYFLKFLSENPDAATIEETAWASTWGIRRFGFFGLPSISIWRRMRKSRSELKHKELEELRSACRNNDFAMFIRLCGGLGIKRSDRDFQTVRENGAVIGVEHVKSGEQHINKRLGEWSIEKSTSVKEPIEIQNYIPQLSKMRVETHYAPQPHELGKYGAKIKYTEIEVSSVKGSGGSYKMKELTQATESTGSTEKGNINGTSGGQFNEKVTLVLSYPSNPQKPKDTTENTANFDINLPDFDDEVAAKRRYEYEKADEERKFQFQEARCAQNLAILQANAARSRYYFRAQI